MQYPLNFATITQKSNGVEMKKAICLISAILCTLFCTSCQSTSKLIKREYPTKIVNPKAPFVDENIEVMNEYALDTVDRAGNVSGKVGQAPVRFVESTTKSFKGISNQNPYERAEPYYRKDFQKDMLAMEKKGVTTPTYVRGQRYANAFRSPFIFKEELERGGTQSMTSIANLDKSLLAKDYLRYQQDIEDDLQRAEKYYEEGKYAEALELVDSVMNRDLSSQRGRVLFEKIVRAREEARVEQEKKIRERIANDERIAQYINEATEALNDGHFDEALRICEKGLAIDADNPKVRELKDTIELAQFEAMLRASGSSSLEVLENMIYKHLQLYQQYTNEALNDLAKKELQKVTVLETYRDKIAAMNMQES